MAANSRPQILVCLSDVDWFAVVIEEGIYAEFVVSDLDGLACNRIPSLAATTGANGKPVSYTTGASSRPSGRRSREMVKSKKGFRFLITRYVTESRQVIVDDALTIGAAHNAATVAPDRYAIEEWTPDETLQAGNASYIPNPDNYETVTLTEIRQARKAYQPGKRKLASLYLTTREAAAILAALRIFQAGRPSKLMEHIADQQPLSTKEIDALCERIVLSSDSNAREFVRMTAKLNKDGECATCGKDGDEPNTECVYHQPWDMPNDDAVDTLHSLISEARDLTEGVV
ncbi:MAG: hypothetical protein ACREQI_04080 [Candidatus Binataceae bacterium]